eukprot:CAMPEP_0196578150 /NCGR_PEP_ID=MMETSP1081-20130531/7106_1 /TAXON_ID=36882 /ORGANISM="Pyramimonas amylifera, Strain CCMP720" /LENGTH=111 /DNA_ID=CAMNT_0041897275 /DNA_START=477 /DNA_END=812 /DNA_ORIENTATION=-
MSFTEFLEGVARVSEMLNPLSAGQQKELIDMSQSWDWDELNFSIRTREWDTITKDMRKFPLHEHLPETLKNLFEREYERWDVSSEQALCKRLDAMTLSLGSTVFGSRNIRR